MKTTKIELEWVNKDGTTEKRSFDLEHAQKIMATTKKRKNWSWRVPEDSQWTYDEATGEFQRKKPIKKQK